MMNKIIWFSLFYFVSIVVYAQKTGVGGMASNLMNPVSVMSGFLSSACLLVGGAFLFASIIKYVEHRRSPLMVTMGTVIFLFIAGVVLILLPLTYMLTDSGLPYSLR